MKNVFPEMICAATRSGAGVTSSVMGGMYIDMMRRYLREKEIGEQRPISFLFLHDEGNLATIHMRFTQYFGNDEHYREVVGHFDRRFKLVAVAPSEVTGDHTAKIKAITDFMQERPDDDIWVYMDTLRTFRLACTNATGMVVPFTVETGDELADVFAGPNARLRYAGLALTLGGRPA